MKRFWEAVISECSSDGEELDGSLFCFCIILKYSNIPFVRSGPWLQPKTLVGAPSEPARVVVFVRKACRKMTMGPSFVPVVKKVVPIQYRESETGGESAPNLTTAVNRSPGCDLFFINQ
jgi:hypothetical protein